jgi:Tfp pilus assembly protein PilP
MTSWRGWLILALTTALLGGVAYAQAQQETGTPGDSDEEVLQRIEQENEAVQQGRQFSYDPAGRRDPFEPLVKANKIEPQGKRPRGIAGMLISEIALRGIIRDDDGELVALFNGSDNRGYTLRIGDVVYDGRILDINAIRGTVQFRQRVDDPRRIKPYRDVTKRLYPSNEEEIEEDDA